MAYRIHSHMRENQFFETTLESAEETIDFACDRRKEYKAIKVYQPDDSGLYNCVLAVIGGHARWGEYTMLKSAQIRVQELDGWSELAAHPEYKRVTLDQVEAYYAENRDEILDSLWPEMPEQSEVVALLAHENNSGLIHADSPETTEAEVMTSPVMQM